MSKTLKLNIANLVIGENEQEIKSMLCDLIKENGLTYLNWDVTLAVGNIPEVIFTVGLNITGDWKLGGKNNE